LSGWALSGAATAETTNISLLKTRAIAVNVMYFIYNCGSKPSAEQPTVYKLKAWVGPKHGFKTLESGSPWHQLDSHA